MLMACAFVRLQGYAAVSLYQPLVLGRTSVVLAASTWDVLARCHLARPDADRVAAWTDNPVRGVVAQPFRFYDRAAAIRNQGAKRPPCRLAVPSRTGATEAASRLRIVRSWRCDVPCRATHPVRRDGAEPAFFQDGPPALCDQPLKGGPRHLGTKPHALLAKPLPPEHTRGPRSAFVPIDAPEAMRSRAALPLIVERRRTHFCDSGEEPLFGPD